MLFDGRWLRIASFLYKIGKSLLIPNNPNDSRHYSLYNEFMVRQYKFDRPKPENLNLNSFRRLKSAPSVLIVDDDENLRYSLAMILQKEGFRVRTTGCGHLAMEMMDTWHFDLLVLDLNLADYHGHDIIAEIQKRQPAIQVLVLTATPAHDTELEAKRLQVLGYLMKPIEPEILVGRVRKALPAEI